MLIENGANVNAVNKDNDTALIFAAKKGNNSNMFAFIAFKNRFYNKIIETNVFKFNGHTDHEHIARLLIDNGADINAANTNNSTALLLANKEGIY